MALTDIDDFITRVTTASQFSNQTRFFYKNWSTGGSSTGTDVGTSWQAGIWHSLWTFDGSTYRGAIPTTTPANPEEGDDGTPNFSSINPDKFYLMSAAVMAPVPGDLFIYDRLLHVGGLSAAVTTAQTVGGTLTRHTGGAGNFIFWETYAQTGTTATTITASYTNQAGTSGRTTPAKAVTTSLVGRGGFLPLAAGDTGVQSVQSITLGANRGTAGNIGVTIGKPIGVVSVTMNRGGGFLGVADGWMPQVDENAAVSFLWRPSGGSLGSLANLRGVSITGAFSLVVVP